MCGVIVRCTKHTKLFDQDETAKIWNYAELMGPVTAGALCGAVLAVAGAAAFAEGGPAALAGGAIGGAAGTIACTGVAGYEM
ncbi:hypothetical protein GCM10023147_42130 [Tsukamurella soli]|uniref:Bacteriocin class II with double-glycine leader peptide n=1 Tax=Tsukamurella soli TaxID=644556 RepID=A0ABP8K8U4_9ACTN